MNLTFYIEILADVFYTIGILTDLGHESDSYLTSVRAKYILENHFIFIKLLF